MTFSIFYFIFFYILIVISVLGFGFFFKKFVFKNTILDYGFLGILGTFFLTLYSYISNLLYSHNQIHNSFILILGIIFFILKIRKEFNKYQIYSLIGIFSLLFVAFVAFKTHDDFPYYHFAYTDLITKNNVMLGLGNFNHGFRTPSSLFYLNSLYSLPLIENHFYHIGAILIMGFSLSFVYNYIFESFINKKFDYIFYFSILSIIFILIFFYRISEHGSDRSAQILVFLIFIEIMRFFQNPDKFKLFCGKLFIISSLVISLKSFYIVYLILILPILYLIFKINKKYELKNIIKLRTFYCFLSLIFFVLLINFFNTGCLVYPAYFTCLENFSWSISIKDVKLMNEHYENWAKAGAGPNFKVDNISNHIMYFNWLPNWIDKYFFNKVSDFLFGLIFLIFIIYVSFFSKRKKKRMSYSYILPIYLTVIVLFLEWFYNHPALRYGGYILICLLIFIPFSIFTENNILIKSQIKNRLITLIFVTISIFVFRNIDRINNEISKYGYDPLNDIRYELTDNHYRIEKRIDRLIKIYKNCNQLNNVCDFKGDNKVKKILNRYVFYK